MGHSTTESPRRNRPPGPRACLACRQGKIKCDLVKPDCGSCNSHSRACNYTSEPPKARPSRAIIDSLLEEKKGLQGLLWQLKAADPEERDVLLSRTCQRDGVVQISSPSEFEASREANGSKTTIPSRKRRKEMSSDDEDTDDEEDMLQASEYLSFDEAGQIMALGPTSSLHNPVATKPALVEPASIKSARDRLFANAATQRQLEYSLHSLPDIDGIPIDLATHLLDLYWNRPHHAFLVVYRPAFTRDLLHGGPYATKFLTNAIFAAASKYSDRSEVRENINDPRTSGAQFFRRAEALITADCSLPTSEIPTASGLILLASALLARGSVSKSWLYSGMAIKMIYDLGLHLDTHDPNVSIEEIEIRRRLFWGAFVYDKIQSLYLGRPFMIHPEDANVPLELLDMMEERDLYIPYTDPADADKADLDSKVVPTLYHSVSNFENYCRLCKIMARIIRQFYLAGVPTSKSASKLEQIDRTLSAWYSNLPDFVAFQPWVAERDRRRALAPPNIMVLNTTYHSVVILLHRPFLSDAQLSEDQRTQSWLKCSTAARNITSILRSYRMNYTLRGAPYLASYASYVACTIHIRNAGLGDSESVSCTDGVTDAWESRKMLEEHLEMLDELAVSSPCITWPTNKIRRILRAPPVNNLLVVGESVIGGSSSQFGNPVWPTNAPYFDAGQLNMPPGNDVVSIQDMFNGSLFGFMDGYDPQASWMSYSAQQVPFADMVAQPL